MENKNDYNLSNHPNAIRLAAKDQTKIKSMLIDLAIRTKQLTAKDIEYWRHSQQMAISYENPKRNRLLAAYDDAMLDNHLFGAIRNRKSKVLHKSYMWIDDTTGKVDEELTKLFQASWFKKFLSLSLEATYWGHSLIQFGDLQTVNGKLGFSKVSLVLREHVIPEYHRIVREPMDAWMQGMDYTLPPLSDWCIEIGDPYELGLLLKVCPHTISKKNMLAFWDKFGEIFGMPIRIGTTNTTDPKERSGIEMMLEDMGAAAWGLFPDGTEIKIEGNSQSDSWMVYDKRIERANSEMSKAILGETMTMDNGSSKSQSETHADELMSLIKDDTDDLRDIVNDKLTPFLIKKGFNLTNRRFIYDESIELEPKVLVEIEKLCVENFEVDPVYFTDKYKIPITGPKKVPPTPGPVKNFF